jgi:general secretion pathway protein A
MIASYRSKNIDEVAAPVPSPVPRGPVVNGSQLAAYAPRSIHDPKQVMYGAFYGLKERPFDLTSDPRFLYLTGRQREALANLRYGLVTPRGFTLLLGDAGTGKTTLLRAILTELTDANCRYVLLSNPTLSRTEFYEFIARGLALSNAAAGSKTQFLSELQQDLEERLSRGGGLTGLIIDEAQSLPYELLEEIRLLGNMETTTAKLLNVVLAGQPELADRLNEPSLRQLKQRISLRCELTALTFAETAAYIAGRLRIAGGSPAEVFTREAILSIYRASAGIPRLINVVCDNVLIGGFAEQIRPVTARIVDEVCADFDLRQTATRDGTPQEASRPRIESEAVERPESLEKSTRPSAGTGETGPQLFQGLRRKRRFSFF